MIISNLEIELWKSIQLPNYNHFESAKTALFTNFVLNWQKLHLNPILSTIIHCILIWCKFHPIWTKAFRHNVFSRIRAYCIFFNFVYVLAKAGQNFQNCRFLWHGKGEILQIYFINNLEKAFWALNASNVASNKQFSRRFYLTFY